MDLKYTVTGTDEGKTVKYILKNRMGVSAKLIKKLKLTGQIYSNNAPVFVKDTVRENDEILIKLDFNEINEDIVPENIQIDILYEDECLLAINKPADTVVHPTWRHQSGTVANAVMYYLLNKGICTRIRPVSRLDRDTTGVIIFALNQYAQESLVRQMKSKTFIKEYIGIVKGIMENDKGVINLPIERKPDSIMLRHISETGSPSVTHYEVLKRFENATLLKFTLETGRTHQIRVHCQAVGHPLIGDTLYPYLQEFSPGPGGPGDFSRLDELIKRHALHSRKVIFNHPVSGEKCTITAPIPEDFKNALIFLKNVKNF